MAIFVYEISFVFLLAMLAILAVLVIRRWRDERSKAERDRMRREAARTYLARVEGAGEHASLDELPLAPKLEAVSHLLRLMRGAERDRLLELGDEDHLFDAAIAASNSSWASRRSEAVETLEQFGSPRCVQTLEVLLANDVSMTIRLEAAAALARLGALPSLRDTISLLKLDVNRPTRLHVALFSSLAARHPEQIREVLAEQVPASMRAMLIDALSNSGDLADLSEFERAAAADEPEVRSAAMRAARRFGDPRCEAWVLPLLSDPADFVRMQAAQTVAKLGFTSARPRLEQLVNDESVWVRIRAGDALSLLPGPTL